jgi:UDP-N-acetylmuramate dehydrogenase
MPTTDRVQPDPRVSLAPHTTLGIGGDARWFLTVSTAHEAVQALHWARAQGQKVFVLGGGSNLVVSDEGFDGLVLQVGFRGLEVRIEQDELHVEAGAGQRWDGVVAQTVAAGFGGLECLSGIPGTVGGTPIQNVGAYGQEVAGSIAAVTAIDREDERVVVLKPSECDFGYRHSRFKGRDRDRFIITHVSFLLKRERPTVVYADVAEYLERAKVAEPTVEDVRRAVLTTRRGKGMVVDLRDTDTRSVGSFFTNPVVTEAAHADLDRQFSLKGERTPGFRQADGNVKIPAAWLIERAGFPKGYQKGAAGISTKHPLALINRGGATAREIIDLAVEIKQRVANAFGIRLRTEPIFVGLDGDERVAYLEQAH